MPDLVMDDSGPAASSVSPRLLELRQMCDRMDIKWHWKHKESSLEKLIKENVDPVFTAQVVKPISANTPADESNLMEVAPPVEQRSIPQDVLDALAYCNSYHRANTARIKEYIESIL